MANLSNEQFQLLLDAMKTTAISAATTAATSAAANSQTVEITKPRNDPAVLGPMRQCTLGDDKMRKLTLFDEWLEEAEYRMEYIGTSSDKEKIILLRTWGGQEFKELIKRQSSKLIKTNVPVKKEDPDGPPALEGDADESQTSVQGEYQETIKGIRELLMRNVNRTMAMYQLMNTRQGTMSWNSFIRDLEIKAKTLNLDKRPYTIDEAIKDAAIFGMNDTQMKEKALAEDPSIETLSRWCQARESGKEDAHQLKGANQVKKVKAAGRFSAKHNKGNFPVCDRCSTEHEPQRCPLNGKPCFSCGGKNHFAGSTSCPNTKKDQADGKPNEDTDEGKKKNQASSSTKRIVTIKRLSENHQKWVEIAINGVNRNLFTDTGSEHTIIPPEIYDTSMGPLKKPDINLRAWGCTENLEIKGMIEVELENAKGAKTSSKVYVVEGHEAEPLLGDKDAEELGFIIFNREGREPTVEECATISRLESNIPQKLRDNLEISVDTKPVVDASDQLTSKGKEEIEEVVNRYKGSVFNDTKIGCMKIQPIHLDYDADFKPRQPSFRNIPFFYQEQVSNLLSFLKEEGVISDVDPRQSFDCVMNVVITDKANGQIRMNIDNTPRNPGLRRTKFHVQTPQEIRHELKEATIFSEMDMGWAYHQVPIDEETKEKTIFQTHEGLHRMERLYFGPTASSGIFHSEVRKALQGLRGVTNLHDNLLIYSKNEAEHKEDLENVLQRCKEVGITLKLAKSTFAMSSIKWFGRNFNSNGVTADMGKVKDIVKEGRPNNIEDVRSLLMACQYNAKFAFDNKNMGSYEDVTAPLRKLLKKGAEFKWTDTEEEAYAKLMETISDPATLQPFHKERNTNFVSDASELGIQASLYQEVQQGHREKPTWVPVDHVSRALTDTELRYSPIERESLGLSWGMEQFRFYLVGGEFTAWTDHEPLLCIYNNRQKHTSKRIAKHRDAVQDLDFKLQYLRGKEMPCDYGSRHPNNIEHLTIQEQDCKGFDTGREVYVRKIICMDNSPNYVRVEQMEMAAERDNIYQEAKEALEKGDTKAPQNSPYGKVWQQLTVVGQLIYKGDTVVIPDASDQPGTTLLRTKILDIAHEGHPGQSSMKRFLRAHAWFPQMDNQVNMIVQGCLQCQAATETKHRDPLIPSKAPPQVWSQLDADHWGPTDEGKYILVVVDETSKYADGVVVNSTSAEPNIEAFDRMFSTHGYPEKLKTDGGPPFNGKENHQLQKYFKWAGIQHKTTVSADDPEANGLAEAFMKHIQKVWHTARLEGNDPKAELNKHLLMYNATPHPSTGFAPAELMFGRKIRTRLPNALSREDSSVQTARENDNKAKQLQKKYKDAKPYVREHSLKVGDQVLLKQKKSKSQTAYNPEPFIVTEVNGHQITADKQEQSLTRDAQKWKRMDSRVRPDYVREEIESRHSDTDSSDGDELLDRQLIEQEATAAGPDTQDTVQTSIRVSSRSTKGKKPDRYGINADENNEEDDM